MCEKMDRMTSADFLRTGDVIGVSRGVYEHYAIYAGKGRVIHYAGNTSDFNGRITIHEAAFEEFIKKSTDFFIVSFEGKYPVKIHASTKFIAGGYFDCCEINWKKKYSPEKTLKRANSRIGENKYSIITNNCEHFALWCKTGNAESTQVRMIASYVLATGVGLGSIVDSRKDIVGYLAE